jgi:nucleoside-diphosphate-sugar epimerase
LVRLLITGSAGFLGRNLARCMSDSGHVVVGLDARSSEYTSIVADLTSQELIDEAKDVDAMVHLAAYPNPRSFNEAGAFRGLRVNVMGTVNMLELARETGARFILYSTSNVYGVPSKLPVSEEDPIQPFEGYGWSKVAAEAAAMAYHKTHGLPVVILRLWKPYGPFDNGVVGLFIRNALRNEDLVVNNGGLDSTDFMYVDDLCEATRLAMVREEAVGQVFNVGVGVETRIIDLAKLIIELTGSSSRLRIEPRVKDPFRSYPSINKASSVLGFRPRHDLASGLRLTIDWFRRNMG